MHSELDIELTFNEGDFDIVPDVLHHSSLSFRSQNVLLSVKHFYKSDFSYLSSLDYLEGIVIELIDVSEKHSDASAVGQQYRGSENGVKVESIVNSKMGCKSLIAIIFSNLNVSHLSKHFGHFEFLRLILPSRFC